MLFRGLVNITSVSGSILISGGDNWRSTEFLNWSDCCHLTCVFTHGRLQVAIKVLRGGSSSRPDFREHLIRVYFLITRVMQTALAPVLATSPARHPVAEAIPSLRC